MGKLSSLKKALDMSHAARMKRADEMGMRIDEPVYIGTGNDFEEFDLSRGGAVSGSQVGRLGVSSSPDPEVANEFAMRAAGQADDVGPNVIPAYYRSQNQGVIDLAGDETNEEIAATVEWAWENGYDSIRFRNYTTPGGLKGREFILNKEPNQQRSVNATFDPAKKGSAKLLASVVGAGVLAGASSEDADAAMMPQFDMNALMGLSADDFMQRRAAKKSKWAGLKSMLSAPLEFAAGVNQGVVDSLNFLGPDQVNAILNLSGSEKRIPTFSDIPGINQATQGGFMQEGLPRDIVRTAGEFISPL